jgi:hypothetical protein
MGHHYLNLTFALERVSEHLKISMFRMHTPTGVIGSCLCAILTSAIAAECRQIEADCLRHHA